MSMQQRTSSETLKQQQAWFAQNGHCVCKEELELKDTMMEGKLSGTFAQLCEELLGLKGMRLDLFYD